MLLGMLKKKDVVIDNFSVIQIEATQIFDDLINKTNGWGNGRDISTLVNQIMRLISKNFMSMPLKPGISLSQNIDRRSRYRIHAWSIDCVHESVLQESCNKNYEIEFTLER